MGASGHSTSHLSTMTHSLVASTTMGLVVAVTMLAMEVVTTLVVVSDSSLHCGPTCLKPPSSSSSKHRSFLSVLHHMAGQVSSHQQTIEGQKTPINKQNEAPTVSSITPFNTQTLQNISCICGVNEILDVLKKWRGNFRGPIPSSTLCPIDRGACPKRSLKAIQHMVGGGIRVQPNMWAIKNGPAQGPIILARSKYNMSWSGSCSDQLGSCLSWRFSTADDMLNRFMFSSKHALLVS
jgi:hypothetical protein